MSVGIGMNEFYHISNYRDVAWPRTSEPNA